ncbi:sigma-70 family RNA polymerase sigma factor [Candidatus Parcubacteria bacterium]|nr:sigma-70 family RNA polymerase sigma factor [Candidatus Parcubacteria bacterium]
MHITQKEVADAQHDPEAFGRLYDLYYRPVFGFMYSRTGNAEVAKDLTSETFFQALKNLHRYRPREGATFKSWLFAIGVAQIGNYYRQRAKMFELTIEEAPEIVGHEDFQPDIAYQMGEDADDLQEKIALLRQVMKQLNQRQQDIITLRFFSKMTVPEIAGTLQMKEGTIKSHLHRALKKLQTLMTHPTAQTYETSSAQPRVPARAHGLE